MSDKTDGLWQTAEEIDGFTQAQIDEKRYYVISFTRPLLNQADPFRRTTITEIEVSGKAVLKVWNEPLYQLLSIQLARPTHA